ncbi:DegT/DnrJ/EryC1/StrS family aminotransferase [Candidatus Pelagibacter sp.]|nr:DegT/DnrJ/EryC1/StrS family aminotransferase [Candidatus Pelagibacter sp.]
MKKISYSEADISLKDQQNIYEASKLGWGEKYNYFVKKFENNFSKKIGAKYSLATSSCTGAIHIAIVSLGIKKNSEVLLCDTNWVATVSPVIYQNLIPKYFFILNFFFIIL